MRTINKLRMMMMAVVAIVCGTALYSCGDDDDDNPSKHDVVVAEENKLDSVEMRITYSVTQDLYDMYDDIIINASKKLSNKYEFKSAKKWIKPEERTFRISCNADRLPATFCARISTYSKKLTEVKDSYQLGYDLDFTIIAYYKDGREEVVTSSPYNNDHAWYQYSIGLYNPSLEDVEKAHNEITTDLMMGYHSFIAVAKVVENGKEVVKVYNDDEKRIIN